MKDYAKKLQGSGGLKVEKREVFTGKVGST